MIMGTPGDDYLQGTTGNDSIFGDAGNDAIYAGGGQDDGDSGVDTIDGGTGTDAIAFFLNHTTADILYDAVAASTSTGVTLSNGTQIKNVEKIGWLLTGAGNDTLKVSTAQGAFHWDAGAGQNRLIADYSSATVGIQAGDSFHPYVDGYTIDSAAFAASATHFTYPWFNLPDYALATGVTRVSITGGSGNDGLFGTNGDDTLVGGAGNDVLNGSHGHDLLDAGAGDDYLESDYGHATMLGGAGNDYFFSGPDANADSIDGGAGIDSIFIEREFQDWSYNYNAIAAATSTGITLTDGTVIKNVEHLAALYTEGASTLTISAAQGAFYWEAEGLGGNTLIANYSARTDAVITHTDDDTLDYTINTPGYYSAITGGYFAEALSVTAVSMTSGSGNDSLTGTIGDDTLNGGKGIDIMAGGDGNDTYYVDNTADQVIEHTTSHSDGGIDRVFSTVSYTLGDNVEHLNLDGTANINGTGNGLQNNIYGNGGDNVLSGLDGNDKIKGGAGSDTIIGGVGNDILEGGDGADKFVFSAASVNGKDTIQDFVHGVDKLVFATADYGSSAFTAGTAAVGSGAQFVWNETTHTLSWDHDGAGGDSSVQIAVFANGAHIDASDFAWI